MAWNDQALAGAHTAASEQQARTVRLPSSTAVIDLVDGVEQSVALDGMKGHIISITVDGDSDLLFVCVPDDIVTMDDVGRATKPQPGYPGVLFAKQTALMLVPQFGDSTFPVLLLKARDGDITVRIGEA